MPYIEDLKLYAAALAAVLVIIFFGIFFYKWYTKPIPDTYCGEFNNYVCEVGKCGFLTRYESGSVGYCQRKILGL